MIRPIRATMSACLALATCAGAVFAANTAAPSAQPGQNFTAGNGMEMIWVPPMNGWAGKYLVIQPEYEKVMGTNPSNFRGPRRPVETVSWNDAMAYCRKLTDQDHASGLLPAGFVYTLPTAAQYDIFVGDAKLTDAVTSLTAARSEDADVGTKAPNQYGLYDTRGNLWEWCLDWYDKSAQAKYPCPTDPGSGHDYKVLRGGSWFTDFADNLLVMSCISRAPDLRFGHYGFRCVAVPASP